MGKEGVNFLFAGDIYIQKTLKALQKKPAKTNIKFCKVARCKINIQKLLIFYTLMTNYWKKKKGQNPNDEFRECIF